VLSEHLHIDAAAAFASSRRSTAASTARKPVDKAAAQVRRLSFPRLCHKRQRRLLEATSHSVLHSSPGFSHSDAGAVQQLVKQFPAARRQLRVCHTLQFANRHISAQHECFD